MKVLFLGKKNDAHCERAIKWLWGRARIQVELSAWDTPLPENVFQTWHGDLIISFLSRWRVPAETLKNVNYALNFHPAPPKYRGVGGVNYAILNGDETFGCTCHHMAPKIDSGKIVAVKRFSIGPYDTVETVLTRTYDNMLTLFYEVIDGLLQDKMGSTDEEWGEYHNWLEMLGLYKLNPNGDLPLQVRATSYGKFQPYVEHQGMKFYYDPEQK